MKITSIKNVAIAALAVINIVFLSVFLFNSVHDRTVRMQARANLVAVMERGGIKMSDDSIDEGDTLVKAEAVRDTDKEKAVADALCGSAAATQSGGNIYTYAGQKGTAEFRSGGDFNMTFASGAYRAEDSAKDTAQSLLETMKIEARIVSSSGEDGNETVTAQCSWNGTDIFNCTVSFVFQNGDLTEIRGKLPESLTLSSDAPTDMSSAATAVLTFLGVVTDGRYSCSEITGVEPGYLDVAVSASGDGLLRPAWKITADTGVYFYDTSTQKIERSA